MKSGDLRPCLSPTPGHRGKQPAGEITGLAALGVSGQAQCAGHRASTNTAGDPRTSSQLGGFTGDQPGFSSVVSIVITVSGLVSYSLWPVNPVDNVVACLCEEFYFFRLMFALFLSPGFYLKWTLMKKKILSHYLNVL